MSSVPEISTSQPSLIGNFNGQNLKLRQITVEEYDLMIKSGVFDEDEQVELLNGAIVEKMPKGPKHSAATYRVAKKFFKIFEENAIVRLQDPIWLDEFSEPEPDIVPAAPREDEYENSHPTPAEIYLIIEVSDSTLSYDRTTKYEAYARAGIRQYIVLNIQEKFLEDYRKPGASGFQSKQTYRAGQQLNLVAFPDVFLTVDEFLPVEKS